MRLKRLIHFRKDYLKAANYELTMPGEPLIYSVKSKVGKRFRTLDTFRNMRWKSILRCCYAHAITKRVAVVILVRFFVSAPVHVKVSTAALKAEKTPALEAFEIADYLLSYMEMIKSVLISNYRQIVKVEAEKYYSANPRTVMKFLKWDQYVALSNQGEFHTKTESISAPKWNKWLLQSERERDAYIKSARQKPGTWATLERSIIGYDELQNADTEGKGLAGS